jgi:hypothetical protein
MSTQQILSALCVKLQSPGGILICSGVLIGRGVLPLCGNCLKRHKDAHVLGNSLGGPKANGMVERLEKRAGFPALFFIDKGL